MTVSQEFARPCISIVMPFRDAGRWIGSAARSVLGQTVPNWELIAVDDGSVDDSQEILARAFHGDRRLRIVESHGEGLVDALNIGLENAGGDLIARMDADDLMIEHRLSSQKEAFEGEQDLAVVGSLVVSFGIEPTAGWREYIRWLNSVVTAQEVANEIYHESPFAHPSVMFRKRTVLEAGGYRKGDFPEDYELWLRLHHRGARMRKVAKVLLKWRDHERRATRIDPRYGRDRFDAVRARYLAADPRLEDRDFAIWGAGRVTRRRADHLIERRGRPVAWIDIDPKKTGKSVDGVPVVPPDWLKGRHTRPFVLIYIARHGARREVARELEELGYECGRDWLNVG